MPKIYSFLGHAFISWKILRAAKVIAKGFTSLVCTLNFIFNNVLVFGFETSLTDKTTLIIYFIFFLSPGKE